MNNLKKYAAITLLLSIFLYFSYGLGVALHTLGFTVLQSVLLGGLFGAWVIGIICGTALTIVALSQLIKRK